MINVTAKQHNVTLTVNRVVKSRFIGDSVKKVKFSNYRETNNNSTGYLNQKNTEKLRLEQESTWLEGKNIYLKIGNLFH